MLDFKNASFVKLHPVSPSTFEKYVTPFLLDDERILSAFQSIRDGVVFTNKRIIAINVQGLTGTKKDISSLPYKKIQAFSVETAGVIDLDSELTLWFSGLGTVTFEFSKSANVSEICRLISSYLL